MARALRWGYKTNGPPHHFANCESSRDSSLTPRSGRAPPVCRKTFTRLCFLPSGDNHDFASHRDRGRNLFFFSHGSGTTRSFLKRRLDKVRPFAQLFFYFFIYSPRSLILPWGNQPDKLKKLLRPDPATAIPGLPPSIPII